MAGGEIPGKVLGKGEVDASASIAVQETHSGMGLDNFNSIMLLCCIECCIFYFRPQIACFLKSPTQAMEENTLNTSIGSLSLIGIRCPSC